MKEYSHYTPTPLYAEIRNSRRYDLLVIAAACVGACLAVMQNVQLVW